MGSGEEAATTAAEASTASATSQTGAGSETAPAGAGREAQGSNKRGEGSSHADGLERPEVALTPVERLRITLLRNVRYHEDRQVFLTSLNGVMNLAVLLSGTGVVATLTTKHHGWSRDIAILTAIIGAVQLIFDWSRRQFLHETMRARFLDLVGKLNEENVADVRKEVDALYAGEPPTYYALDALAYNAAMRARGRPTRHFKIVGFWYRRARNFWRFTDTEFKSAAEIAAEEAVSVQ